MINIDKLRKLLDTWSDDARSQAFGDGSTREYFDGQIAACAMTVMYTAARDEVGIIEYIREMPVTEWIADRAPKGFVDGAQSIMDLLKVELEAAEHGRGLVAA